MKLLQSVLYEQHATRLVDLTLKEIISAGKVTNPYQLFVLGHLSSFFKNGCKSVDLYLENPVSFNDQGTSSAMKEALLALSDAEHVKLATYLLDCTAAGESLLWNRDQSPVDWMHFVLGKQY
jgi:hypothetical protein